MDEAGIFKFLPRRTSPGDIRINFLVKEALSKDERVNVFEIEVSTLNKEVTLKGTVRSPGQKSVAVEIVCSVEGVTRVKNELQIDASRKTPREISRDTLIAERIKGLLDLSEEVYSEWIKVNNINGVVHLIGRINTHLEKEHAESIANTKGVIEIINELMVEPHHNIEEDAIVAGEIKRSLLEEGLNINVEVINGVVYLGGFISSTEEKRKTEDIVGCDSRIKGIVWTTRQTEGA